MEATAVILDDRFLYWNAIILTLAALSAILAFLALSMGRKGEMTASWAAVPLSFLLSMLLSRMVHWYCRPQGYESFLKAVSDYSRGGFSLLGVFFGCFLAALLLRTLRISKNLPAMLDRMAIAGALGISGGRMAAAFSQADLGPVISASLPWPLDWHFANPVSGEPEVRLAVFVLQGSLAFLLFAGLLLIFLKNEKKKQKIDGDIFRLFLLFYGGTQAVLDSLRYDSLYFRFNGFVSVVQIASILSVLLVLLSYVLQLKRAGGKGSLFLGLLPLPFLLLCGYMEYYVQRHGSHALQAYTVMGISMAFGLLLVLLVRKTAISYGIKYKGKSN